MDPACFFTLNLLFGIASMATILIGVVFLNYEVVSQAVLIAIILYPTAVLANALKPHPVTGRVDRKARVSFLVGCFVSLFFLALVTLTPVTILLTECPNLNEHHNHHQHHDSNQLEVTIRYTLRERGVENQRLLLLHYNVSHRKIVRRQLRSHDGPEEDHRDSWLELEREVLREKVDPVCSSEPISRFYFLEREIEKELREMRREAQERPMLRVFPHNSDDHGYEELRLLREELRIREICRYEYGFTILYISFVALLFLLELFTLLWYTFQVKDE
jgi:hypothetical protein